MNSDITTMHSRNKRQEGWLALWEMRWSDCVAEGWRAGCARWKDSQSTEWVRARGHRTGDRRWHDGAGRGKASRGLWVTERLWRHKGPASRLVTTNLFQLHGKGRTREDSRARDQRRCQGSTARGDGAEGRDSMRQELFWLQGWGLKTGVMRSPGSGSRNQDEGGEMARKPTGQRLTLCAMRSLETLTCHFWSPWYTAPLGHKGRRENFRPASSFTRFCFWEGSWHTPPVSCFRDCWAVMLRADSALPCACPVSLLRERTSLTDGREPQAVGAKKPTCSDTDRSNALEPGQ